jgi:Fur family transcriptional regulator, ferric uptake regulator
MPRSGGFGPKPSGRAFMPSGGAASAGGDGVPMVGRRRASSPPGTGAAAAPGRAAVADDGERIERLCIERGLKMTGQRRLIARVLSEAQDHPDVEEVYRRALALDSKVSIATVYRTVRLFEERGILERHDFGGGRARYEPTEHGHHHHLIDVDTGQVVEFGSEEHEQLAREIAAGLGFELVSHRLELFGRRAAAPPGERARSGGAGQGAEPPPSKAGREGAQRGPKAAPRGSAEG